MSPRTLADVQPGYGIMTGWSVPSEYFNCVKLLTFFEVRFVKQGTAYFLSNPDKLDPLQLL